MKKPKGVGVVATDQAPKAIGPYSQAVEVNGVIYTAGQVALDAASGQLVGTSGAEQTEQFGQGIELGWRGGFDNGGGGHARTGPNISDDGLRDPGNRNDVWYSDDGVRWQEVPNTPWKPRHAASVFVHDGALWMVAGNNMESDVWKLQRAR